VFQEIWQKKSDQHTLVEFFIDIKISNFCYSTYCLERENSSLILALAITTILRIIATNATIGFLPFFVSRSENEDNW